MTRHGLLTAGVLVIGLVGSTAAMLPTSAAAAGPYTVDDLGDDSDASPGDGACATAAGGCTLRAAIEEAADEGPTTITVPAGTVTLSSPIVVVGDVALVGAGTDSTLIDLAGGTGFVLDGASLSLRALRVSGGIGDPEGGAAIYATASTVTLDDVMLDDHRSNVDSGAILAIDSTLSIVDSTLSDNSAQSGGAVFAVVTALDVRGSTFENNGASQQGAAIFASFPTALSIVDSSFVGNTSIDQGGAIYVEGVEGPPSTVLQIVGSTFEDNMSGREGGAIFVPQTSNGLEEARLQISGSVFRGNVAVLGGALAIEIANVQVVDSLFAANRAWQGGGAIASGGQLSIDGSSFEDNASDGSGGAIASDGPLTIADSSFHDNSSGELGGALALYGDADPELTDVEVTGNIAALGGGGYWRLGGDVVSTRVTVSGNEPASDQTLVGDVDDFAAEDPTTTDTTQPEETSPSQPPQTAPPASTSVPAPITTTGSVVTTPANTPIGVTGQPPPGPPAELFDGALPSTGSTVTDLLVIAAGLGGGGLALRLIVRRRRTPREPQLSATTSRQR